jgi:hypothetical protein
MKYLIRIKKFMLKCFQNNFFFQFTDKKIEKLEAQIEAHLDTLVNEQAYFILTKTDLLDAYKIIQNHEIKTKGPLYNVLGMDANTLKSAMVFIYFKVKFIFLNIH